MVISCIVCADLSSNAPRNAGAGSSANDLLLDLDPLNAPPGSQPMPMASGVGGGAFGMAAQSQPQAAPSAAMFSHMLQPPMATGGLSSNNPFAPAAAPTSAYSLQGPLSSGYGNLSNYAPTGGSVYGGQPPYASISASSASPMSFMPSGALSAGGFNSALNNPPPAPPQSETLSSAARAPASASGGAGASGNYLNSAWLKFEEEGGVGALTGSASAGGAASGAAPNSQYVSINAPVQPAAQYPSLSGMTSANLTAARSGGGAPPARSANSAVGQQGDNPLISF